jgi:Zn-dependent M28 family amino/carboxypeptidase
MRRKFLPPPSERFLTLLLALALVSSASAQAPKTAPDAPDAARLRAHVTRLASDEMDGRRTGTPGAQLAAEYIAAEFRRLGLRPAAGTQHGGDAAHTAGGAAHPGGAAAHPGGDARHASAGAHPAPAGARAAAFSPYAQPFPYVAAVELGRRNSMSFSARAVEASAQGAQAVDLRVGEDWTPLSWSANGTAGPAGVVFVGHGITAAELGHDDYAGADVRGLIALALAGTPDGDNPHGRFGRFADLRFKAAAARDHGARALVVVTREENFKDDRAARLRAAESAAAGDAGLPVVLVSRQVARRAVSAAALPSVTFERLEQAAGGKEAAAATTSGTASAPTNSASTTATTHSAPTSATTNPAAMTATANHTARTATTNPAATSATANPAAATSRTNASAATGVTTNASAAAGAAASQAADGGAHAAARKNASTALPGVAFRVEIELVRREAPAFNVIGLLEGSDPKLKDEVVVVGAHYDHLGRGGEGSLATREGDIHHGADDNASGTSALLELARIFAASRPRRTIVFAAFGGEEEGLLGSNFYVNRGPAAPLARTVAMINMDMVGRLKDDRLVVGGVGTAAEWRRVVEEVNAGAGEAVGINPPEASAARDTGAHGSAANVSQDGSAPGVPRRRFALTLNEDGFGPSDHSSFYARQIPVLFFWTGTHEDYHKPTDTAERINYEGLARITGFVRDVVRSIDRADAWRTYARAKSAAQAGRSTGFRVYLGTIPSYAEGGDGMKLDGVREGSPAARAGLRAGDVIVRMAGREVKNVYDYTYALGEMKAGEEYEVEVLRGAERLKFKLTPAPRN